MDALPSMSSVSLASLTAFVIYVMTSKGDGAMAESVRITLSRKPLIPKPEETEQCKQILEFVSCTRVTELALRIKNDSGASTSLVLPARLARFVLETLSEIAYGNAVRLLQIRRELTTHEAAELFNVSRTHLIGL